MDNIASAVITGTGANIDVRLGWTPERVEVHNLTDTANLHPVMSWISGYAAGSAIKRTSTTTSRITTGGITALGAGASDTIQGFRIGNDAAVNVNGNSLQYIAYRGADPKR